MVKNLSNPARLESPQITEAIIKHLKVKVSRTTVREAIQNHPDSMTILSVNDCLLEWGIDSSVYRVDRSNFENQEMYYPFVAQIPEQDGHFLLVYKIENGTVYYKGDGKKNGQMPLADFLTRWSGIALHAEVKAESGESNYIQQRTKEVLRGLLVPALVLLLTGMLAQLFSYSVSIGSLISLIALKLVGITLSVLLLIQSLNANNPFIKNLCTLGGKNDCNAILKSEAAKVTPWLSWSEVGFFYFAGSFLLLIFTPLSIPLLSWLNVLTLPYTVYSLSYQYRHKNWCVLCCGVQAVLLLEAATFLSFQSYTLGTELFTLFFITKLLMAFLLPIMVWGFLKPFFSRSSQLQPAKKQLKKFKYNNSLFEQALKNQPKYAFPDELMPVVLGNPEAETVITMVSNPFCGPCAQAHKILDEWLKYRNDFQLKVIFAPGRDLKNDKRIQVTQHLSFLGQKEPFLAMRALNEWHQNQRHDYQSWANNYPVAMDNNKRVTDSQRSWCDMAEVTATPTFFINGYKVPEPYNLGDLKYLI